ncbi:MAG: DUF1444 family protein [Cyanobacteria bacterium SZAS LIN-3]|nr:DUF1444 family protein [Cyanobacteria bacterium SZAS LIN-3]
MVVPPIKNRLKYKYFVITALTAGLLQSCAKPEPEPGTTTGKSAEPIKIEIAAPPTPAVADAQKRLPENIFDNRLEAKNLTESEFTSLYGEGIHKAMPQTQVIAEGPLKLSVRVAKTDRHSCKIDLHKLWALCKDRPGHREELVRPNMTTIYSMVAFIQEPLAGEDPVDKIVPLIRGEKFIQTVKNSGKGALEAMYYEKLFGDLYIVYGVDDPPAPKPMDRDYLEHYAKTKRELLKGTAMRNIERMLAQKVSLKPQGAIFNVTAGGTYDPSLILLDRYVKDMAGKVNGRLVAAIPTRETLFICGDATPGALAQLRQTTEQAARRSKMPVSENLFILDDGQWRVFKAFD